MYADSGWSAFREQVLREPGTTWTHLTDQGVAVFHSAHEAGAFFDSSAQNWPACTNRQFIKTVTGRPDIVRTVGPVVNTNGTLSASFTAAGSTWTWQTCQRALTVANNVVVDVEASSSNRADSQSNDGVNIAHQIAAKIPTT